MTSYHQAGLRQHSRGQRIGIVLIVMICLVSSAPRLAGQPTSSVRSPVRGLTTPQQLLELFGIDQSHLRFLIDGLEVRAEDIDVISKILMRFSDLGGENIQRWLKEEVPWDQLVEASDDHRIDFFTVAGQAERIEQQAIVPEAAGLYGFDHFYWVWIRLPQGQLARIATRTIPASWPRDGPLEEAVRVSGMYLKYSSASDQQPQEFLFAAERIEWFPKQANRAAGIPPGQVALGQLGMDVSLFDRVRTRNRRPVGASERDCFYRLLQLLETGKRPTGEIKPIKPSLTDLLRSPQDHHGEYLQLVGTVRRITNIQVASEEIELQFGISNYYQLDMFVPLGNRTIQIKRNPTDQHALVFENRFPLSVCVAHLPAELVAAQAELDAGEYPGTTLNETLQVTGFFFKLWSYRSTFSVRDDHDRQQLSPMILAYTPRIPAPTVPSAMLETVIAVGFMAALLMAWLLIWRGEKDSKQSSDAWRQRESATTPDQFAELADEMADDDELKDESVKSE